MHNKLALPPFGKILFAYQEQHIRLNYPIYIHLGKEAKQFCINDLEKGSIASYLPANESVLHYNWPIIDQHIALIDHGDLSELQIKKIIFHFRSFKPRLIYLWSEEHPCLYLKENSNE